MATLLVLYSPPADTAKFDAHYQNTHIPLARKMPGMRSFTVTSGQPRAFAGSAPYLVAQLQFDSMASLEAALASPEGQAAVGDLPNFAQAGVTVLAYETSGV